MPAIFPPVTKLRSIRARLNHLQTVIDGQESRRALDKMSKLHRFRLDTSFCTRRSGSSQLASDETLSRTACPGTELHCEPTRSVDHLRPMIAEVEGRKPRKKKAPPQPTIVYNTVYNSGAASSATISSGRRQQHLVSHR